MKYIYLFLILSVISSCNNENSNLQIFKINGQTMGTYYNVSYVAKDSKIDKSLIDQRLEQINKELSTYISTSTISSFNKNDSSLINTINHNNQLTFPLFDSVFQKSKEIYQTTNGYFDPTIMPLVNYWGFGYKNKKKDIEVDSQLVSEMLNYTGFNNVSRIDYKSEIQYAKNNPKVELDFSAIAKGFAVDLIGTLLEENGIQNYLVDIGGELVAKGIKPDKNNWAVGISKPEENAKTNEIILIVELQDIAMASSGNYIQFYESNGKKFSHTINPKTGYTERNELLSVSIIAKNCMIADAIATSCMAMGYQKSTLMIKQLNNIEACFILNDNGKLAFKYSSNFESYLQKSHK